MTESINKCRGCIVGSRIHREVYVRFRGEGSETCCRETVRRRILSLQHVSLLIVVNDSDLLSSYSCKVLSCDYVGNQ